MPLIELTSSDKEKYNNFVAAQPSGSFLQAWEWGEWQEKLGKKAYRFFIIDDSQDTIASLQIIKSPLPFGKYYLYLPYGPVIPSVRQLAELPRGSRNPLNNYYTSDNGKGIPPLVPADDKLMRDSVRLGSPRARQAGMTKFLVNELLKKFPDVVFIRVEPKAEAPGLHQLGKKSANIQPGKTLEVDLSKTADELLAAMHPKTRYNIKLAQRHGVEVASDLMVVPGHGLYFREALDLIVDTAGRQSFQSFPRSYYQKMLDHFALQNSASGVKVSLYKALLDRELLAAAIMVDYGNTRTYLFGGSSQHRREVMAPHLLHWRAMTDAKGAGLKFYDFWGIETASGETPGFVRFKLGFGGISLSYPGAYDITNKKLLHRAYKILRGVNRAFLKVKKI